MKVSSRLRTSLAHVADCSRVARRECRGLATSVVRDVVRPRSGRHGFSGSAEPYFGSLPSFVKIVEVGPRDGLQNEKKPVDTDVKIEFINRLSQTGLSYIEATSYVSKKWVPQMGDAPEVMRGIRRADNVTYSALTPNIKGLEAAIESGTREVAIFGAASDAFSLRNINCNVMESFERFKPLMALAKQENVRVRGYVSCVLGCPYQGYVAPDAVGFVAQSLLEMGCYEISLGDTIGVGTPLSTRVMLESVRRHVPLEVVAVHLHNTYGSALSNILAALELGVSVVDSSVAGLGGCPYAKGASGNVPTEDVVYMLHGMGIRTNTDLDALVETGQWMCDYLGKPNQSKTAVARLSATKAAAEAGEALAGGDASAEKALAAAHVALGWPQPPSELFQPARATNGAALPPSFGAAAAPSPSAAAPLPSPMCGAVPSGSAAAIVAGAAAAVASAGSTQGAVSASP